MRKFYCLTGAFLIAAFAVGSVNAQSSTSSLDLKNLDTSADPGVSFYQFATGGWQKANPLTDEYARYGAFDVLRENSRAQIRSIIEGLGKTDNPQGSIAQKIGDVYALSLDSVKRNKDGATPVLADLKVVADAKTREDIIRISGEIRSYAADPFFSTYVGADAKNSTLNLVSVSQGGLGMGNRDYYINADSKKLRDGYVQMITNQFINVGYNEAEARVVAANVMNIETELAKSHITKEAARIPENNYHKMPFADLNSKVATFDWQGFFDACGLKGVTDVDVSQIEPVAAAIHIIQTTPIDELKQYLSWCILRSASSSLSDAFYDAAFDFYGKQMSGKVIAQPRWKRSVSAVEGALGEAVGQMYVKEYFPAESKARMLQLVQNLRTSLDERIKALPWMSKATKAKAHEKLSAFIVKIGYPDKWKDYSSLKINKNDSYYENMKRASEFGYKEMIDKLGKPVDKMEWGMTPQTVNAYYNPGTNEICFPAAILQPPFFYSNGDDAVNYGAIGVVIGHEMTHGFDDQGCKFDKNGNMENWWTDADAKKFQERTGVLRDHFNGLIVVDTVHANGVFTLGENIADQGGLQVSYNAFLKTKQAKEKKKIDGYTPQQRFFLSYANVWAGNIRDAEKLRLTKIDPHALGVWRVDGALPQIDAWYEAFGITSKDPLYIAKDKRVSIW